MNLNVINVVKNSHFSYQSQITNAKNLLSALIAKVKVQREYFQDLSQSHLKRVEDWKNTINPLSLIFGLGLTSNEIQDIVSDCRFVC